MAGKFVDGWSLVGLTVLQSGQPYSIIDFSGAVGSIYYSTADGITNPIVPLANGCTAKNALDRALRRVDPEPRDNGGALNASLLHASAAACGRAWRRHSHLRSVRDRIHHRPAQHLPPGLPEARRCFAGEGDQTSHERYNLKYTFDVYNLTNTTSFDVPGNEVSQNAGYNAFPYDGQPVSGAGGLYSAPAGLGLVTHTIGAPRQIQMSLHLEF